MTVTETEMSELLFRTLLEIDDRAQFVASGALERNSFKQYLKSVSF